MKVVQTRGHKVEAAAGARRGRHLWIEQGRWGVREAVRIKRGKRRETGTHEGWSREKVE